MSFDPATENEDEAQAKASVPRPRLDPKYPWRMIAFDPWEFGVQRDPSIVAAANVEVQEN